MSYADFQLLLRSFLTRERLPLLINLAWVFSLRAAQLVLGMASTYFLVRAVSKEDFGEYQFVLSIIGVLTLTSLFNLKSATMQAVARGNYGSYRPALRLSFLSCFLGSAGLIGMAAWQYFQSHNTHLAMAFAATSLIFPFTYGLDQWKGIKAGEEKYKSTFFLEGGNAIVMNIAVILACLMVPGSYVLPIVCLLLFPALRNIFSTLHDLKVIPKDSFEEADNVSYGLKSSLYLGVSIAAKHLDKILLFAFLSPVALATYAVADRVAELIRGLVQDMAAILSARFARKTYDKQLDRMMKVMCLGLDAVIILFAFTLMPYMIHLIFGEQYTDSIPYAQAMVCSVAIGNFAVLRFRFIRSKTDLGGFKSVTLISSATRAIAAIILIPLYGLVGAVIAAFLFRIATTLSVEWIIRKKYLNAEA